MAYDVRAAAAASAAAAARCSYLTNVTFNGETGDITSATKLSANAIGLGLGASCRVGTIKRHFCGSEDCDPKLPHKCNRDRADSPMCDMAVTAEIASPEMWAGEGIGLETDIYAFGVVMW